MSIREFDPRYLTSMLLLLLLLLMMMMMISGCEDVAPDPRSLIGGHVRCAPRMRIPYARNASGIAFNPDTGTLFVIQDSPPLIREINFEGRVLRDIKLTGMDDMEGIAYMGEGRFILAEESTSTLLFVSIAPDASAIDRDDSTSIKLDMSIGDNEGFEGVAYDEINKFVYAVKEKNPKTIMRIHIGTGEVDIPFDLEGMKTGDASGICIDPRSGNLLILSQESRCIVECTVHGELLAVVYLTKGWSDFKRDFDKPEGITIDPASGKVFVCGENDEFYILGPKK
ncbi:MAG: SdiA-regulated domain-containing protein [Victivallales bacterium]|nr:SdiA-regulated domain-containing protein [Victivallales bacterium]